jgi:hypothetical protein
MSAKSAAIQSHRSKEHRSTSQGLEPALKRFRELTAEAERLPFGECTDEVRDKGYGAVTEDVDGHYIVLNHSLTEKGVRSFYAEQRLLEELRCHDDDNLEGAQELETKILSKGDIDALKHRFGALLSAFYRIEAAIIALPDAIEEHGNPGHKDLLIDEIKDAYDVGLWIMATLNEGKVLEICGLDEKELDREDDYRHFRDVCRAHCATEAA